MRRLRPHAPSPAMVVACVALVVALGGTGYAAITLPRNSVGAKQLRSNAVTSAKVRDGSLRAADFPRSELPRGPRGAQGPPGASAAGGTAPRSGFASRDLFAIGTAPQAVGTSYTEVLRLGVAAGTAGYVASSGPVVATGPGRLVAHGEAVLVNDRAVSTNASCRMLLTGPSDERTIGNYENVNIPAGGGYLAAPVSAGVDVEAGSYDVRMQCLGEALTFHRGNMIVMLTPR